MQNRCREWRILTSDGYFVIGEMNAFTSTPGRLQFVAGGIDASDLQGNVVTVSLFCGILVGFQGDKTLKCPVSSPFQSGHLAGRLP